MIDSTANLALCLFDMQINFLNDRSTFKLQQAMHKQFKAIDIKKKFSDNYHIFVKELRQNIMSF